MTTKNLKTPTNTPRMEFQNARIKDVEDIL